MNIALLCKFFDTKYPLWGIVGRGARQYLCIGNYTEIVLHVAPTDESQSGLRTLWGGGNRPVVVAAAQCSAAAPRREGHFR